MPVATRLRYSAAHNVHISNDLLDWMVLETEGNDLPVQKWNYKQGRNIPDEIRYTRLIVKQGPVVGKASDHCPSPNPRSVCRKKI